MIDLPETRRRDYSYSVSNPALQALERAKA